MAVTTWEEAIQAELDKLDGRTADLKRITLLELARAKYERKSKMSVFDLKHTVTKRAYITWRQKPEFVEIEENIYKIVNSWRENEAIRALAQAREFLDRASPFAAQTVVQRMRSEDERVNLNAAKFVINTTGLNKAESESVITIDQGHDIVSKLLAAIKTHVEDPEMLASIANEFRLTMLDYDNKQE